MCIKLLHLLLAMKQHFIIILLVWLSLLIIFKSIAQSSVQLPGGVRINDNNTGLPYIIKNEKDIANAIANNLFIKVNVSNTNCVLGEPILVTYKLYTRLQSESKLLKQPEFSGCSVIEMTTDNLVAEKEVVGGKIYKSYIIRQVQLVPLQLGSITLGTAVVENTISFFKTQQEAYYGMPSIVKTTTTTSTVKTINVKPLPAKNQPANFKNTIGTFIISAKVTKATDTVNGSNNLELRIDGIGNFQNLECPNITWPNNIEHFEVEASENINKFSFPVSGKKIFNIPFSCKQKGKIVIEPISFSFFDTNKQAYQTISTDSIYINVLPAVALIDASKLSTSVSNAKYIWIVPCIAVVAGLILWLTFFVKKKDTYELSKNVENVPFDTPINTTTNKDNLNNLLETDGDIQFFQEAKALAINLLNTTSETQEKDYLQSIIENCNLVLYAYNTDISKDYVFKQLEKYIIS